MSNEQFRFHWRHKMFFRFDFGLSIHQKVVLFLESRAYSGKRILDLMVEELKHFGEAYKLIIPPTCGHLIKYNNIIPPNWKLKYRKSGYWPSWSILLVMTGHFKWPMMDSILLFSREIDSLVPKMKLKDFQFRKVWRKNSVKSKFAVKPKMDVIRYICISNTRRIDWSEIVY